MTPPIGVNKVTCLANSDTIVGIPFRKEGSRSTLTTGDPIAVTEEPDLREIPLQSLTLEAGSLVQHYLKFDGGTRDGRWYDITANTASSVTIDLNGDNLTGVVTGDRVVITEYWTLDTLFPPAQATTAWTEDPQNAGVFIPNGHAIVASTSPFPSGRRTEMLFPNYQESGINLAAAGTYYIYNGGWRKQGEPVSADFGSSFLVPDYYIVLRHPSGISHETIFRANGEVTMGNHSIPLSTRIDGKQDNLIGLTRAVNITLNELSLGGTQAFLSSTTPFPAGRRDELLVFNNEVADRNKAASATYYYYNGAWRMQGQPISTDFGGDEIKAAFGFIIRKYQDANGETVFWNNTPSY